MLPLPFPGTIQELCPTPCEHPGEAMLSWDYWYFLGAALSGHRVFDFPTNEDCFYLSGV